MQALRPFSRFTACSVAGRRPVAVASEVVPTDLRRTLATRPVPNRNVNKKSNNNNINVLVNEDLVKMISKRRSNKNPRDIQVRVVTESGATVVSLPEAIQQSVQRQLDLIGISLQQDVPVVRIDRLKTFLHRQQKSNATGERKEKEIRMQHKIAEHDLERKIGQISQFVAKGHRCVVRLSPSIVNKVVELLPPNAELINPPTIESAFKATLRIQAKKK